MRSAVWCFMETLRHSVPLLAMTGCSFSASLKEFITQCQRNQIISCSSFVIASTYISPTPLLFTVNRFLNMAVFTNPEVVQLKLTSAALYKSHNISASAGVTAAKLQASSLSQSEKQRGNPKFHSISYLQFLLPIPLSSAIYLFFHTSMRLQSFTCQMNFGFQPFSIALSFLKLSY